MTSFEEIRDRALDLAQAGVAKAKELTDIAKLNIANTAEEEGIRKAYIELGKLYYAERGMAPEGAYVALCEKITECKTRIEENKTKINEMRVTCDVQD
ncbi:MAG: serine proteinase, partial [Clostridia bacterium]|nr:serine proteinase [Clostridia bacterium]